MTVIDSNAYIGSWAFRNLKVQNAEGLLSLMDSAGIDKAAVSSVNAILFNGWFQSFVGSTSFMDIEDYAHLLSPLFTSIIDIILIGITWGIISMNRLKKSNQTDDNSSSSIFR